MKEGYGKLTSANGTVFTGRWYQDKKHGQGETTGVDKQVFVEYWKYGAMTYRKLKSD